MDDEDVLPYLFIHFNEFREEEMPVRLVCQREKGVAGGLHVAGSELQILLDAVDHSSPT